MTLDDLQHKISNLKKDYQKHNQIALKLFRELSELRSEKEQLENKLFLEFIKVGLEVQIESGIYLKARLCTDEKMIGVSLRKGDVIKICKINKKSIIFEHQTKKFKFELVGFSYYLLSQPNFKQNFLTWCRRCNNIDFLLVSNQPYIGDTI